MGGGSLTPSSSPPPLVAGPAINASRRIDFSACTNDPSSKSLHIINNLMKIPKVNAPPSPLETRKTEFVFGQIIAQLPDSKNWNRISHCPNLSLNLKYWAAKSKVSPFYSINCGCKLQTA